MTLAAMPSPEFNPLFTPLLLVPMCLTALFLIAYLYHEQRRLASHKTVITLTLLRLALIFLLFLLFLRPTFKWTHTQTSSGTLWLLVDQSPSMQSADPQSTSAERARWADALGGIPAEYRPSAVHFFYARFLAVKTALYALEPANDSFPAYTDANLEARHVREFLENLAAAQEQVSQLRDAMAQDKSFPTDSLRGHLDNIHRSVETAHDTARSATSFNSIYVDWPIIKANVQQSETEFRALMTQFDRQFNTRETDTSFTAATSKVNGATRSNLAFQFLTNTDKRPGADTSVLDLVKRYRVRIATFADSAQPTAALDPRQFPETLDAALRPAEGSQSTSITSALQVVSSQVGPDEAASVIILSDGRHNTPGDPTETARLLAARGIRVYGLLVGSHEVSPDAAVDQVEAPEWIFKGDTLTGSAVVRLDGLAGRSARFEIVRKESSGAQIPVYNETVPIVANQLTKTVNFTDRPPESAPAYEYEARVQPVPGETNTQNNKFPFRVAVKKEKLYALMIDSNPRWEFRYLSEKLGRDARLMLQTVDLNPAVISGVGGPAPVKASPQNHSIEAQLLPETKEEWQAFDFIVLGDVPATLLTVQQQQFIASAVRDKGATLIVIAGQRHMPDEYADSPLAEVLPVILEPQWSADQVARHVAVGFKVALAPEGSTSVLGQFDPDVDANSRYWSGTPLWYWHSPFTQAKPAAAVIWSITDPRPGVAAGPAQLSLSDSRKSALLATISVGLGRSLYFASDQSWRLRSVAAANVHERFWGQVLRWAVGSDLPAGGKFVRFGASQPRYAQGQPVTITARVLREDLTPYTGLEFSAVAKPTGPGANPANSVSANFHESRDAAGYYTATLGGLPVGDVEISLKGPAVERLLDTDPTVTQKTLILTILPAMNLEQNNMDTNPDLLARIAAAGSGYSVDANFADVLASNLPKIERTDTTTEEVGFFTDANSRGTYIAHWSFLALFALILTTEWVIRKFAGLL